MGVEYAVANTYVGKDSDRVLADAIPANPTVVIEPGLSPWSEIQTFLETPKEKRQPLGKQRNKESRILQAWWLQQMQHTRYPLQERMTLFWHNHFTSSIQKVQWPQLMYRQNQLFRQHATGNFKTLLKAVAIDPAMLIYLDNRQNSADSPNENFARELLELFTLGIGHYTEADIVNAARALTGWVYNLKRDKVVFQPKRHDKGKKQFLGKEGNFKLDDIIEILLDNPRTAEFISGKFWYEFVSSEKPDPEVIRQWATAFRDNGYDIRSLLEAVFNSDAFWSVSNRGTLIKSPIEFSIGILRSCPIDDFSSYPQLVNANNRMGQSLFAPPDVKGWRGGNNWIDETKLIERYNLVDKLLREDVLTVMDEQQNPLHSLDMEQIIVWFLPLDPVNKPAKGLSRPKALLALLQDPVYQLR